MLRHFVIFFHHSPGLQQKTAGTNEACGIRKKYNRVIIAGMQFEKEMPLAIQAAVEAGRAIMDVYESEDFEIEMKGNNSPLTKADRAAHECIVGKLESFGLPVLSEEGKSIAYETRKEWKRFWLVDPLDGTKEFISRNGEFTVNIALIEDGAPLLGVVYVPVLDELFYGAVGQGSYYVGGARGDLPRDDELREKGSVLPFKNKTSKQKPYRVVGSRSHMNELTTSFIDSLRDEHPGLEIVQRGSSLKICMVAAGDADIYPRFGPTMEWDTAAGHAIVRAAGKNLVEADTGKDLQYNKENLLNPYFIVW